MTGVGVLTASLHILLGNFILYDMMVALIWSGSLTPLIAAWVLIDWMITNNEIALILPTPNCKLNHRRNRCSAVPSNLLEVSAEATSMDFPLPWRMEESSNGILVGSVQMTQMY